jgi:hypothetical protein
MHSAEIDHLRMTVRMACLVLVLILTALPIFGQEAQQNNTWYSHSNSDTVFIFVHGIFSDSKECWTAPNKVYWPEILKTDTRFGNPDIFLGGYYTERDSGVYRIHNATDQLLSHLRGMNPQKIPGPLAKPKLVFIAHSTGGLVVQDLLERNRELFKDKIIGLVLVASPSHGSAWADRFTWLKDFYGNEMVGELALYNAVTMGIGQRFAELVDTKKLKLTGIHLFENKLIGGRFFGFWRNERIVKAEASASYFGAYKLVPGSDHFSIAKPVSVTDESHHYLWYFFETKFLPFVAEVNKASEESHSPSTPWIEVTKSILTVQKPLFSDEFKMKNVRDKQIEWFFRDFPEDVFSLHAHATEGKLETNTWSDRLQVRGYRQHIVAQRKKEYIFFIQLDYGNLSRQEKMTIITDDPNDLRERYHSLMKPPRPR